MTSWPISKMTDISHSHSVVHRVWPKQISIIVCPFYCCIERLSHSLHPNFSKYIYDTIKHLMFTQILWSSVLGHYAALYRNSNIMHSTSVQKRSACSSDTLITTYKTTWCHNPKDHNPYKTQQFYSFLFKKLWVLPYYFIKSTTD